MDFACLGGWVKLGRLKDEIWLYWNVLPWYSPEWLCFFIYYLGFLYVCLLELYILWWWFVENFQFWQVYDVSVWSVVIAIKDERSTPDHRGSEYWTVQPRQDSGHGGRILPKQGTVQSRIQWTGWVGNGVVFSQCVVFLWSRTKFW